MEFGWTKAQAELHQRMRELGKAVGRAPPEERMAALAAGGALGLSIGREYGGGGHDLVTTARAYEGLGSTLDDGGLLLAAGAHLFGVAMTVQQVGRDAQRQRFLGEMAAGTSIATVAATESGSGSDVAAVEAVVAENADGASASGDKRFVTYADKARWFLFVGRARASDGKARRGLTTAIIEAGAGVSVGEPLATIGLAGARLAPVRFDRCALSADALLGRAGAGMAVFQIAMTYERALVLAFRLGAMQRALEEAVSFVQRRKLGSRPLSEHQAVTHRLARMQLRLESARLLTYRAAWLLDAGVRAQPDAALAKWQVAEAALDNALDALRVRGGAGYLRDAGLGVAVDDALGGSIHSGTADVLANIIAGWLGV